MNTYLVSWMKIVGTGITQHGYGYIENPSKRLTKECIDNFVSTCGDGKGVIILSVSKL